MDAPVCGAIEFTVPGVPVPWARAGSRSGVRFTPAKQRGSMAQVKALCIVAMADRNPIEGPVELTVHATWIPPASWSRKKREAAKWKTGRPDVDNLGKLVADALNGVAYLDDAQVVRSTVEKTYGPRAELVVRIVELLP